MQVSLSAEEKSGRPWNWQTRISWQEKRNAGGRLWPWQREAGQPCFPGPQRSAAGAEERQAARTKNHQVGHQPFSRETTLRWSRESNSSATLVMELKVWVDGIQRVVCGVSDQTTCQEVVIALARAIGQTGRYILIQKLREKERQLLPHECPLESLAKCGQYANDVQFILQRTGPSLAERPSSDSAPQAPERTFIRASLPIKPRPVSTEVPRSREPKKSMTFNLGPMGSSDRLAKSKLRLHKRDSVDSKDSTSRSHPSKEELFKTVLHQQEQLHSLEVHGDSLETDLRHWEQDRGSSQEDEILYLEHLIRRNEMELGEEEFWQSELHLEKECERERQEKVRSLRATMEEYTQKIHELTTKTEVLEKEIQLEITERARRAKEAPADLEDMAAKMKRDLEAKAKQSAQLESSLASVGKALEEAERNLQAFSIPAQTLLLDQAPSSSSAIHGTFRTHWCPA
ncbi:ras association domain-containing protein 7 isoform X3 [Trachemys scripta elegans]|uniref:ras association domain-containing protein 7 isoform X3 n=2 Tax=Emydidae TaxID=8476 RepID=UPI0015524E51|nr:ras association domain-containing protein 7 isoform X3 [Trachemys scripta elegans]XP_034626282.1 ras association domain-containing protein 7 isoform X3 [Trachemys scripta elegans]